MYLASYFSGLGRRVTLLERENDYMQRASFVNQARVHQGYHYPRSVLTALRSRVSFPRFVKEFPESIFDSFEKYYLIGKHLGKVTARQFERFCQRIGAPFDHAPAKIARLVNPTLIEACFTTVEYAFNSLTLRSILKERLERHKVEQRLDTTVISVARAQNGNVSVEFVPTSRLGSGSESSEVIEARHVFNCTYASLNSILERSKISLIPLKHEVTELCLVEVPEEFQQLGITVMCGPFFSCMPFPSTPFHSFSHVRYTPHREWYDTEHQGRINGDEALARTSGASAWAAMRADARRYVPLLGECKYKKSLWEVKTVLPLSEVDDSRPILFRRNQGIEGFHCVMGGKIDNVYDVIDAIEASGGVG